MGAVFALFAGFYYWTPKIVGRNINDFLGKIHFWTFFVGVNLTFFPQHFLGLAGIFLIISNYVEFYPCLDYGSFTLAPLTFSVEGKGWALVDNEIILSLIALKPYGPHLLPQFLNQPVRVYKPNLNRNLIGVENRGRTVIYQ